MFGRAGALFAYFTRHGTAANLLLVLMLAAGIWAIPNMRSQYFPDVIIQNVTVGVTWEGAGAEDVDATIVQLMEPALLVVEGVAAVTSRASEGRASITLEFEPNWDMTRALEDVQAAVDGVTNLPDEAETPTVRRVEWRDRVTDVVVTGPVGVDQLARLSDEFVSRLYAAGVTRTTIQGLAAPQLVVELPSRLLIEHDLGMTDIAAAIAAEVRSTPAGEVSGAGARIRTGTPRRSAEDIAAIPLRAEPDGTTLTIGDLATIRAEGVDRSRAYYVGDNPAMTIRVDRAPQGDAIAIQRDVERVAAEMRLTLPDGVALDVIRSRTEEITSRLNLLVDNAVVGLGLVVVLLFLFLNARVALWVAAGIPVAMLAAIAAMYALGLSINMMSLFALIITLGIVVDDAIVVGEHADYRARELGESPAEAAENAATRMAAPVFSATLTTVIAFFTLVAIGGRFGTLIADIPLTVIAVLMASLVECFLVLPNHLHHALAGAARRRWYDWPSHHVNRGFVWVRERLFRPFMGLVVRARYPVLAGAILLLAMQGAAFLRGDLQWRFFNSPEEGSIAGNFAMLPSATRTDTIEMMREMQRAADEVAARYEETYGRNPLAYVMSEIGGNAGRGLVSAETKEDYQLGAISVELIDVDQRDFSAFQFVADLQEAVRPHPLLEEVSFRGGRTGPGGDALSVQLYGADADVLKSAAEAVKAALQVFPEVSGLEDSLSYDMDELVLRLTPQGEALGFTIDALGRTLRARLSGIEAATYPDGPRSAAIRVELPEAELTADFLDSTLVRTAAGQYVPLGDIVSVSQQSGFAAIRRENGLRVVTVSGDLAEDDPARAAEISARLRDTILPDVESSHGVSWRMAGLAEQEQAFLSDAAWALLYCLLGIYGVLAWIFGSWMRPLVVMAVIPFGLVGALWGHGVWGMALSMFSVVGLIGLSGIIINDSIVLVTTIDQYRKDRAVVPAIIDGACDRLRPVFLTTLTTVLGLAPLLYERSSQAEFLKPTVITLVYGLGFGMVLVLLVVPALIAVQADIGQSLRSLRRLWRGRGGALAMTRRAGAVAGFALVALLLATLGRAMIVDQPLWPAFGFFLAGGAMALAVLAFGLFVLGRRRGQPGQPSNS
ncbi:efflux RND transporter permease subunit [Halodurantibacterium flavum]|uniref:Efflux RND transporter permease subunit n=1 Tax=Halodurantibacterium flavum TaxID=1382802 RepID=A0ABW4S543_9RHOB